MMMIEEKPRLQPMVASYGKILREAADIADERGQSYGDVAEGFEDACRIAYAMFGKKFEPIDIAEMMIAVKTSRDKFYIQDDNSLDIINYRAIRLHLIRRSKNKIPITEE